MDITSLQQNSKMEGRSTPKQLTYTSEQENDIVPNDRCTTGLEQKQETTEGVEKTSLEAKVEGTVAICFKQLTQPQESTEILYCEQQPQTATLCNHEPTELQAESVTGNLSKPETTLLVQSNKLFSESVNGKPLPENQLIDSGNVEDGPTVHEPECGHTSVAKNATFPEENTANSCLEPSKLSGINLKIGDDQLELTYEAATNCNINQVDPQPADTLKNHYLEQLGPAMQNAARTPSQSGHQEKRSRGRPKKAGSSLSSSAGSTRLLPQKRKVSKVSPAGSARSLRSRSQEKSKPPESINNLADVPIDGEKKMKKRKKKRMDRTPVNEFARIKTHLRYLLHRIKYEQNFIDAYSGEGWKGQSLEKIKPEKELQRAKSEIFRRKLKIRDLFQRLDLACSEGRIPEALFDSAGEIDSEDIFCAKCGSKDVDISNDIILCDGACERGFHQFCLEPPLLKEHIPPGDEGWLCPGCDCKVDCVELLNEAQGTKISVSDGWEKVFPEEAAAAAAGNKLDDNLGLPSDDSEDDDYNPDGPQLDEKVHGAEPSLDGSSSDGSSSDESDYYSASDDVGALPNNEQTLGLPSDDSEDDDYDPSCVDPDQEPKIESSSSDFTSDSEDFSVAYEGNQSLSEVQGPNTAKMDDIMIDEDICGKSETKKHSLNDSGSIYPKRHVQRLDYKKLHDEEYGETSSDSSDEDYMDADLPKRKNTCGKATSLLSNAETPTMKHGNDASELEHNHKEVEGTRKRRSGRQLGVEGTDSSPARSHKESSAPGSSGRSSTRSYAEDVTQRLLKSFNENQYPERAVKENLARELALSVQQVSKWFGNARWSYRHSSHLASKVAEISSDKGSPGQINKKLDCPESRLVTQDASCNGIEKNEQAQASLSVVERSSGDVKQNLEMKEDKRQESSISRLRKRKGNSDSQATRVDDRTEETPKQSSGDISPKPQARKSSRIRSKNM